MRDQSELFQEMAQKLDALVDRVAGAGEFSEEVRRELRAHLEDKVAAYRTGTERLKETDVLLLVEKHFGDPVALRAMLRAANANEIAGFPAVSPGVGSSFRRLAAVMVAGVAASFIYQACAPLVAVMVGTHEIISSRSIASLTATFTLVLILGWWSTGHRRAGFSSFWFYRLPATQVVGVTLAVLAARWIVPVISIGTYPRPYSGDSWVGQSAVDWMNASRLIVQIVALTYVLIWIGWRGVEGTGSRRTIAPILAAFGIVFCIGGSIGPVWSITQIVGHQPEWNFDFFSPPRFMHIWISMFPEWPALPGALFFGLYGVVVGHWPNLLTRIRHA